MKKKAVLSICPSVIAILIGIMAGWILLFMANPENSLSGMGLILSGGRVGGASPIGNIIYTAIPIILTGLSVGIAFRMELFNIGASGQFTVGAFTAIFIGVKATFLPGSIHTAVAIIGALLAGMLWGYISGFLKVKFCVNEVISGIMLNYIGMYAVNILIKKYIYDSQFNRSMSVADTAVIKRGLFGGFLADYGINFGLIIVIAVVIFIKILLDKTTFGYELRIIGKNRFAGQYSGMNDKRNILYSMMISGALAGLGGALMYLSDFGDHIVVADTILSQGFTGISVALLGVSNPIGIFLAGLFIAHITVGGNYIQLYGYTPEIIDMIIGIIVFCGALTLPLNRFLIKLFSKKKKKE